jgi:hypothetical protein
LFNRRGVLAVIAFAMTEDKWRRHATHSAVLDTCDEELGFTLPRKVYGATIAIYGERESQPS